MILIFKYFNHLLCLGFTQMSDDSEPGEIKSPDISAVIRHKRTAEDKRSYKSEKKLRYDI